jgi:hypothetical protein
MKKVLVMAAMVAAMMVGQVQAGIVVAYWNQNSNALPGGGFGFLSNAFPQAADAGVGNGFLSVGGGITGNTVTNGNGDEVYQWIQSFAGTTVNAQSGDAAGGSIALQGGTNNANNGAYFQFAMDMTGLQDLSVSYASQRTGGGFTTQTWSWSTDGNTFTNFQTISNIGSTFTATGVISLNPISNLNNASTAFLRVVFDGATGSTGNNRLDNITFSATAIPEPSALLLVGSVIGAGALRRRRS